ncbi:MAG: ubiquinone/menaquinone biosynthesis methyltransferase [Candidatus Aminicenantes bacterium]|nr:ubiquinone/menaquinone biosynthesis methyltransferase [Candidatus Aminicenantes bacterium]
MRKGIQKIFSEAAKTYELVNHILTFGLDILWRRKAAREAVKARGFLWLDVCSGTGEMALNLSRLAGEKVKIVSVDFCHPMINRALEKREIPNFSFVLAESGRLPFVDMTFNLVTISFATRNIYPNKRELVAHLKEFHRVLKPEGHFVNLETSQPSMRIIQRLFHLYIRLTVKQLGSLLSGSKAAYRYLAYTIPRFFPPEEFSSILREAGFARVTYRSLFLGVSAIHTAIK